VSITPDVLRLEFPVLERLVYLNASTCGPLPRSVLDLTAVLDRALREGRGDDHFAMLEALRARLRQAYAGILSTAPENVALTTATSDGIVRVLLGLELGAGDEVLIGEGEHPGLLGPLAALRRDREITIRAVPREALRDSVGRRTRLIASTHVAWMTGELAPDLTGLEVPVLLDGAQGAGAIPVDVAALGCAFYAAPGQKWLCGPVGSGMLYVAPAWRDRLRALGPTFVNLADPAAGLSSHPWPDARAFDTAALSAVTATAALAGYDTLAAFGWSAVHERAATLAATLADHLAAAGRIVAPRGRSTIVAWRSDDPASEVKRHERAGVITRWFPGLPWIRAAVGAWNNEDDLGRLLALSAA
jgi:selenocysteine lyase/cysteine desulfurase